MKSLNMVFFASSLLVAMYAQSVASSDIFQAIEQGDKKAVKAWIKSKPNLSIKNGNGQTLLGAAVCAGKRSIVKSLIKAGADVNALDSASKTALDHAVENKLGKVAFMLIQHKAHVTSDVNLQRLKELCGSKAQANQRSCSLWKRFFGFGLLCLLMIPVAALVFVISATTSSTLAILAFCGMLGFAGYTATLPFQAIRAQYQYNPDMILQNQLRVLA
ncbi:ankyrin repeat domain-containing protein [Candidatus Babeliales bacterium]|nr:ankyrin repeat domain-containing protein [Candidatus Babeliales bacterium]